MVGGRLWVDVDRGLGGLEGVTSGVYALVLGTIENRFKATLPSRSRLKEVIDFMISKERALQVSRVNMKDSRTGETEESGA